MREKRERPRGWRKTHKGARCFFARQRKGEPCAPERQRTLLAAAVFAVAAKRVSAAGELYAYLVCAAGMQPHGAKCKIGFACGRAGGVRAPARCAARRRIGLRCGRAARPHCDHDMRALLHTGLAWLRGWQSTLHAVLSSNATALYRASRAPRI